MELLTPDNLTAFVQAARDFLNDAPVELYVDNICYGYEPVTVEQREMGGVLVAEFRASGISNSIAAFSEESPHRTEYQLEPDVGYLLIHVYPQGEQRSVIAYTRRQGAEG
ncbi:MAG TPA: hypothetical protein VFT59_06115 [Candidatus Saccharimonadales bacterium]|nr:hypothetical protein [Candidatus Saccharimonadales bacterium]